MNGIDGIESEYRELVSQGWTISYIVAEFDKGELVDMAQCYEHLAKRQEKADGPISINEIPRSWPKEYPNFWHPSPIAKANLAKAGALVALEWDRLHAILP